ncbi:MAG TPA: HAMP domain-containing sensor histidine kinase [Ktedonobacteraceae bacterium]
MKASSHHMLVRALGWRLTFLNAAVLCTVLLVIAGVLYGIEAAATDAQLNQLLAQTVQQERTEDLAQIVQSGHAETDAPRPFSPAPLQAFFFLLDAHGQISEGAAYRLPGLPDRSALRDVLATGTATQRDGIMASFHLRVLTVPIRNNTGTVVGAIQAYVSLQSRDSELERLLFVLLGGCTLGILLALLAARFLASRALLPIGRALEQQEQFVADASHELRAPLTLLQADVEILNRALRPLSTSSTVARHLTVIRGAETSRDAESFLVLLKEDREILDEMTDEIGHMNTLIADLLTLARYDAGVPTHPSEGVSLTPLLTALTERLRGQVTQAQIAFHLLLPDEPSRLMVLGDPPALHRLFLILLTNAITYTPAGGSIWIQASVCSEKHIQVSVRDTGVGIDATDLPHLFTRFYRVDQARTRPGHGRMFC